MKIVCSVEKEGGMIPERLLLKLREAAKNNGYIHAIRGAGKCLLFIYNGRDKVLLTNRSLSEAAYDSVLNWWLQYGTTPLADQVRWRNVNVKAARRKAA